jgi:DNA replication and repair protein RecF
VLVAREQAIAETEAPPIAAAARSALHRLRLSDFRCYRTLALDLSGRTVVLTGPNGAGKTNILEALSYLSPGRGLRRARLRDVLRAGAPGAWSVAARLAGPDGAVDLGTGMTVTEQGGDRRTARIDGQTAAPAALAGTLGLQWLTPQMDRLFIDGPSSRRRFLDRLVLAFDPDHGRRVGAYERAMRERARLLRDGNGDDAWLSALEARMTADGIAVAAARREAVARLQRYLTEARGDFPRAELTVAGTLEADLAEAPAVEVEGRFADCLRANRRRDGEAGGTAEGPHRTDLLVRHAGKDLPAEQCSTGEQKALLIALTLANARAEAERRGAPPLLLLDEVVAHLDARRRAALFEEVQALGGQAWLSGTDRAVFEPLAGSAQFIAVRDGQAGLEE